MNAERNMIVNQLRRELPKHYNAEFAQTVKSVFPSCKNCEFNFDGTCAGGRYGQRIEDETEVCKSWGPSYGAYCRALSKEKEAQVGQPRRRAKKAADPCITCEHLIDGVCKNTALCDKVGFVPLLDPNESTGEVPNLAH